MTVTVADLAVEVRCPDPRFQRMLERRYGGFSRTRPATAVLDATIAPARGFDPEADLDVRNEGGVWRLRRGDFDAWWDPAARRGAVRQTLNPYSIDSVLRIVHSLEAVDRGGFLLHAASAIRGSGAWAFTGKSGAGKTTISRLAPPDATLLTDEISYLLPGGGGFHAWGTPFCGEIGRPGDDRSAPLRALCVLVKARRDHLSEPLPPSAAVRALLSNVLFFSHRGPAAGKLLANLERFAATTPVRTLEFLPTASVWNLLP